MTPVSTRARAAAPSRSARWLSSGTGEVIEVAVAFSGTAGCSGSEGSVWAASTPASSSATRASTCSAREGSEGSDGLLVRTATGRAAAGSPPVKGASSVTAAVAEAGPRSCPASLGRRVAGGCSLAAGAEHGGSEGGRSGVTGLRPSDELSALS